VEHQGQVEHLGHQEPEDLQGHRVVQGQVGHQDPLDLQVKVTNMQLHQQHLIL
jgi:hypothetical protein